MALTAKVLEFELSPARNFLATKRPLRFQCLSKPPVIALQFVATPPHSTPEDGLLVYHLPPTKAYCSQSHWHSLRPPVPIGFFPPRRRPVLARALYVQPGIAGSRPQGEATRRGPPGERQDLPEGEFGGASGAGWRAPVVPQQRRAQGALEGDAKKAPPAAAPPGSSSGADSGGGAPGANSDEAAHEGQRLRVPAATDLAGKNEELLRASSCKLRVPTAFAPLSPAERDSSTANAV